MTLPTHLFKFGGSSVGSVEAIRAVTDIVAPHVSSHRLVVVVSAMSDVTDELLRGAALAMAGDGEGYPRIAAQIEHRHALTSAALVNDPVERAALASERAHWLSAYGNWCRAIHTLGDSPPRTLDAIAAVGERLSAPQVAAALRASGINAEVVDAAKLIRTNDRFGAAVPLPSESHQQIKTQLAPLLARGIVPVIPGFLAANRAGQTTTLGRGGSDYSAAIIGAALAVDEVRFYKEVDGILTTDPRIVPEARLVRTIGYEELSELTHFGATVLHPRTIQPLIEAAITVRIMNTFNPHAPGTLVAADQATSEAEAGIKAVTALRDVTLVRVRGTAPFETLPLVGRTFAALARLDVPLLLLSQGSAKQQFCFAIPSAQAASVHALLSREFSGDRQGIGPEILIEENAVIVSAIGGAIQRMPRSAERLFAALNQGGATIQPMAVALSEHALTFVVADYQADAALRAIHALTMPNDARLGKAA
ncbi:MAG: aspartate kinase [Ardenticatenales bacterium]|nr:aspartate kinase [Ardenticatenales bacterium]MCB9171945.1 aspartate kinase [Ardenticatenales bacterium]